MIELFIPIEPYPKRTGSYSIVRGKPIFYMNQRTRKYEQDVRDYARTKYSNIIYNKDVALVMEATFYLERPKSAKKRKHPLVKPDLDNLQKSLKDALEGVLFQQDQQIIQIFAVKKYAEEGEKIGSKIKLYPKEEENGF